MNPPGIAHFDGTRVRRIALGAVDPDVIDVWGPSPNDYWLVGSLGFVGRVQNGVYTALRPSTPGGAMYSGVWGLTDGQVFIVGQTASLRWTGTTLVDLPPAGDGYRLQDVYSPDGVTLFALATLFTVPQQWRALRWNGVDWDVVLTDTGVARVLHGQRVDRLWAVAGFGLWSFDGRATQPRLDGGTDAGADAGAPLLDAGQVRFPTGTFSGNPNWVFTQATPDGGERVFVAGDGFLEALSNGTWTRVLPYGSQQHDLSWVAGPPAGPVYAGLSASVLRWDAGGVEIVSGRYHLPSGNMFAFVPFATPLIHAVDDDTLWLFPSFYNQPRAFHPSDGGSSPLFAPLEVSALACPQPALCVAGSASGAVGLFDGGAFRQDGTVSGRITKVVLLSDGGAAFVSEQGVLGRWSGTTVTSQPLPAGVTAGFRVLKDLARDESDRLYVVAQRGVGGNGLFVSTDGGWLPLGNQADGGWTFSPVTVLPLSATDVLVGGSNQFARWNGAAWTVTNAGSGLSLDKFERWGGQVFSRAGGGLLQLSDAGTWVPAGPPLFGQGSLTESPSALWLSPATFAGVLRRPR